MPGAVPLFPLTKFTDAAGNPLAMGWVTVYLAGTTTLATTYQDAGLTVPNTNPVHLDGNGAALLWLNPTSRYKVLVQSADPATGLPGATVTGWPQDNIPGAGDVSSIDVQRQQYTAFTTGGIGTAYTLAPTPALASNSAGTSFDVSFHTTNGASPTISISGLPALNLVKLSPAGTYVNLAASDVQSGHQSRVTILNGTQALVSNFSSQGRLIGVQRITSTQVYTPTPGTATIVVEVLGSAGAGGGCSATVAGQIAAGGGGGAGGYAKSRLTSGFAGVTVTIAPAGAAAVGAAGGNGGTTSFGALLSATGGFGGAVGAAVAVGTTTFSAGGAGGMGVGGNLVNAAGQPGGAGLYLAAALSGTGAPSVRGGGGQGVSGTTPANSSLSPGAGGGGGALAASSGGPASGGTGGVGECLVLEYA